MRRPLSVEAAAKRDLAALPPLYRNSAPAKAYLMLARRLDAGVSARDASMLAREMRLTLLALNNLAPARHEDDPVDELKAQRERRMSELPSTA